MRRGGEQDPRILVSPGEPLERARGGLRVDPQPSVLARETEPECTKLPEPLPLFEPKSRLPAPTAAGGIQLFAPDFDRRGIEARLLIGPRKVHEGFEGWSAKLDLRLERRVIRVGGALLQEAVPG